MKSFNIKIKTLGEAIKTIRKRKNLKQHELSILSGVSTRQIRLLEQGKHSGGIETILLICEGMEVNPFELLVLAWSNDYFTFFEQWQKQAVNTKTKPNDEVSGIANKSKSLRVVTKIKAISNTKCLYGGDNRAIIKINLKNRLKNCV